MKVERIFVSLPMYGRSEEEIREHQQKIFDAHVSSPLRSKDTKFELIDTVFSHPDHDDEDRLWYLGRSIQKLSQADLVIFADGWTESYGCQIEHYVCVLYGIRYIVPEL